LLIPDTLSFFKKDYSFEPLADFVIKEGGQEGFGEGFQSDNLPDTITFLIACKKQIVGKKQ